MREVDANDSRALRALEQSVRKVTSARAGQFSLQREGTKLSNSMYLVAFCGRHRACAPDAPPPAMSKPALELDGAFACKSESGAVLLSRSSIQQARTYSSAPCVRLTHNLRLEPDVLQAWT